MFNAFEFAFQTISDANVVMIGTDSPTFPARFGEDAFAALETDAETVLGKAADGDFPARRERRMSRAKLEC